MKTQKMILSAAAFGGLALGLRLLQYIFAIDAGGYFKNTHLAAGLNGGLVGLLLGAIVIALLLARKAPKASPACEAPFGKQKALLIPALILAVLCLAQLILSAITRRYPMLLLSPAAILGWALSLFYPKFREQASLTALFPVAYFAAKTIYYFLDTYKFIHISAYILNILWLCSALFFLLSLSRAATGLDCSLRRIAFAAQLAIVFAASALPGLLIKISPLSLIAAAEALCLIALAFAVLKALPAALPAEAPASAPDPESFNQFLSELPPLEEEEE